MSKVNITDLELKTIKLHQSNYSAIKTIIRSWRDKNNTLCIEWNNHEWYHYSNGVWW